MDVESLGLDNEALHAIFKSGLESVREFQSPVPDIELIEIDDETGNETIRGTLSAISIKFGLRETSNTSGAPITQERSDGEMKIPANEVIQPVIGNYFHWQGHVIEVTRVYPQRLFTVLCEVKMVK